MKIQRKSYDEERAILIGMIVDKTVLGRIYSKWQGPMFRSGHANKIGQWCIDYYKKYQKAPGRHIQSIFESWTTITQNKDATETVSQFLDTLSRQYRRLRCESNSQYIIDTATKYFNRVKLEHLTETITGDLFQDKVDKAIQRMSNYRQLEMGVGEGINVLEDVDAIRRAFDEIHEPLITFPDGLGKFFGDRLERDGLIAFQGVEKRGKSFWLQEIGFRGIIQRRRVAFFECGDLSEHQIMRRFMCRVARHPMKAGKYKYPKSIRLKKRENQAPLPLVFYDRRIAKEGLSWRQSYKACKKLTDGRHLKSMWRLSCHFNDTLSVNGIQNILDEWARDEWIPDIIIIDYADILNMDHPGLEGRDRIDHTWKQLRRLSQERHCLVVTATQAAARAYKAQTQGQSHFSEDKRKLAHVTGMVGLNQTVQEKEKGIMRLNWIELREGFYSERQCCYVASCFELANMSVCSVF
jgi:hypothetical protein